MAVGWGGPRSGSRWRRRAGGLEGRRVGEKRSREGRGWESRQVSKAGEPVAVAEEWQGEGGRGQRAGGTGRRQRQAEGLLLTDQPCVTDTG